MYRISIVRIVPNPNYDASRATQQHYLRSDYEARTMEPMHEDKALTVDLTDEEFKAVKKAVLEVI